LLLCIIVYCAVNCSLSLIISKSSYQGKYGNIVMDIFLWAIIGVTNMASVTDISLLIATNG